MNIKIRRTTDYNDCEHQDLTVETKTYKGGVTVQPLFETPEDAIIGRDLVSCDEIMKLMEAAYNAGKRGEDWVFTNEVVDFEDFY